MQPPHAQVRPTRAAHSCAPRAPNSRSRPPRRDCGRTHRLAAARWFPAERVWRGERGSVASEMGAKYRGASGDLERRNFPRARLVLPRVELRHSCVVGLLGGEGWIGSAAAAWCHERKRQAATAGCRRVGEGLPGRRRIAWVSAFVSVSRSPSSVLTASGTASSSALPASRAASSSASSDAAA